MGQDKALLPFRGRALAAHVARIVNQALGPSSAVTILGDPGRYSQLGYPVHADLVPNCGPLGGIVTALNLTKSDWNMVVACDMPTLVPSNLRMLVEHALGSTADCVAASGTAGDLEPLCAFYHRRCLAALERALRDNRLKMKDLLVELGASPVVFPPAALANVNTPDEWIPFQDQPR